MSEAIALAALAVCLAAAITQLRWAPEWGVALVAALVLLAAGALTVSGAGDAVRRLGPTVGFLAALLLLADGCRRAGLFDAIGGWIAHLSGGRPGWLLAAVFATAGVTTAMLSLDATIVLLTPIVFATASRMLTNPRPHVYACQHLANSASLLLPVSNLTNLLAFHASGLSFARFGELMALPWVAALGCEWVILRRHFSRELRGSGEAAGDFEPPRIPWFAVSVLALTLIGFMFSSAIGIAPVWMAAGGALALILRNRPAPRELLSAADPSFLVFVLALGVVVHAAGAHGLSALVRDLLPGGTQLPDLLAIAALSAVAANLLNNLPATLIILPVAATGGPAAILAMLIGVNVGPNLTYTGSLATLLWRRILRAHDHQLDLGEFTRLGALTVPSVLVAATVALWFSVEVL